MKSFAMLGVLLAALLGGCATEPAKAAPEPENVKPATPEPKIEYEPLKLGETFSSIYSSTIRQGRLDLDASIPAFEEAKHTEIVISIETRLVEMPYETAHKLFGADGGAQAVTVATPEAGKLVNALVDAGTATVISAPRLTCFDLQRARISVITQHSYISGYEVKDAQGARIVDPIVEVVDDGLVLALKPSTKDGKIGLEIDLIEVELVKPITEGEVQLDSMTLKVQLPVMHVQKLSTKAQVEDGGTLMVCRLKSTDSHTCIVMFVTARKVQ